MKKQRQTFMPLRQAAALLLTVLLLLSAVPAATAQSAEGENSYAFSDPAVTDCIKIQGRCEQNEQGLAVHTTGAGIAFYSNCSGDVKLTLTAKNMYTTRQYLTVLVDGVRERVCVDNKVSTPRQSTVTLASELEEGMHRIEVYRQTEEVNATCVFETLKINGALLPVPEAPMLIEFVGDSITAGAGIFGAPPSNMVADDPVTMDGTQTYAWKTAAALGMDFQACCTSGYGAVCGWNAGTTNLKDMYPYTAYHHSNKDTALWPFERQADIVVINLGTNDGTVATRKGLTASKFQKGATELMELVREKNPNAKIVWVTGMMGTFFKTGLTEAVETLGGADAGYYFCELPKGTSGGAGHPDMEQHEAAAETLIAFLRETVLPADYDSAFVEPQQLDTLLEQTASCGEEVRLIAQAEWQTYQQNGESSIATLTAAYNELEAWRANHMTVWWWILGGVIVAAVAVIVLVAVLYKPKSKAAAPTIPAPGAETDGAQAALNDSNAEQEKASENASDAEKTE